MTESSNISMNVVGIIIFTGVAVLLSPLIPVAIIGYFILKLKPKVQK